MQLLSLEEQMKENGSLQHLGYEDWLSVAQPQILEHIQNHVSEYYPELAATQKLQVVLTEPPRRKLYTVLFDLAINNEHGITEKSLIAKAYRPKPKRDANNDEHIYKCQYEFEMHKKVYDRFKDDSDGFRIIKPCDFMPELLCLVIEKAEGKDLGRRIYTAKHRYLNFEVRKERLGRHFERAGKWLAAFHAGLADGTKTYFEAKAIEADLQAKFDGLEKSGVLPKSLQAFKKQIFSISRSLDGKPMTQTYLHGDLKPCHIFVRRKVVMPIDFGNMVVGIDYEEVGRMLAEIKLIYFGATPFKHSELDTFLQNSFVKGYFGTEEWPPLVQFYYVSWLTTKWLRRLHKHKWLRNPIVKKSEFVVKALAVKDVVNKTYITPWFYASMKKALDVVDKAKSNSKSLLLLLQGTLLPLILDAGEFLL